MFNLLYFLVPGKVSFEEDSATAVQSDKKLVLKIVRLEGSNGRVVVPWSAVCDDEESPYNVCMN